MIIPKGTYAVVFFDEGCPPEVKHIGGKQVADASLFNDRNDTMYIIYARNADRALELAENAAGREPWDWLPESRLYHVVDGRWNSDPDGCTVLYSSGDIESSIRFRDEHTPDGLVLSFKMGYGQYPMSSGRVEVNSQGKRLTQETEGADI